MAEDQQGHWLPDRPKYDKWSPYFLARIRKPILDTKTSNEYPSMYAAGKALARLVDGDPTNRFVWFSIHRAFPDRFLTRDPTTRAWVPIRSPGMKVLKTVVTMAPTAATRGIQAAPKHGQPPFERPSGSLEDWPTNELLALHGRVLDQLLGRGVLRTANNPVGDYAEWLVAAALDLTLVRNSSAHYDATDQSGRRFQIKGRRITGVKASRQLSVIRNLDSDPFDYLAGVLFHSDLTLFRACLVPVDVVRARASYRPYVNGWCFFLNDDVWTAKGVEDLTERLREG